jgi:hypothetical protein
MQNSVGVAVGRGVGVVEKEGSTNVAVKVGVDLAEGVRVNEAVGVGGRSR